MKAVPFQKDAQLVEVEQVQGEERPGAGSECEVVSCHCSEQPEEQLRLDGTTTTKNLTKLLMS